MCQVQLRHPSQSPCFLQLHKLGYDDVGLLLTYLRVEILQDEAV